MSLFFSNSNKGFQLAVWKMDEQFEELLSQTVLSGSDLDRLNSFTHGARKKEWICIRLLLKTLGYNYSISYHPSGKPYIENTSLHISISHTKDFAGLIISEQNNVGVDLERIHPRIEKIAHKFVSDEEEKFLSGKHRLEKLFIVWGVKEVLFKMHSIGELNFKDHLGVYPFEFSERGNVEASLKKHGFEKYFILHYRLIGDLLITYCEES